MRVTQKEYEEFFCPYCMEWLGVEGVVHEAAHHNHNEEIDKFWPTEYRTVIVTVKNHREIASKVKEE